MTTRTLALNGICACSLIGLLASACAKTEKVVQIQPTPAATETVRVAPPAPVTKPAVAVAVPFQADQAGSSWAAIKDFPYDQRASFISGANLLQATLAGQVSDLNNKRAALPATIDTKDWDFAMRDIVVSQSYLKSVVDEAARSSPELWNQEKDKVDQAWRKAEEAFDKVRTATTF